MQHIILYIFIITLGLKIGFVHAQTSVNLEEYVNLVLERHPERSISAQKIEMTAWAIDIASRRQDPNIEIAYAHNAESRVFQGPGMEAALSIPIDWWKTRTSKKNIAQSQLKQVKIETKISEAELKKMARQVYVNTWIYRERQQVLEEYTESIEELFERDSIQFSLGILSEIDFQQTKIEKEKALIELFNFKEEKENAEILFGTLINEAMGLYEPKSLTINEIQDIPSWTDLTQYAWLLMEQEEAIKEEKEVLKLLEKERKINPELIFGLERHFFEDPILHDRYSEAKWTIGMNIPLPFSNKNRALLIQQQKRIEKKKLQKNALSLMLYQDFQLTVNALKKAQQKVILFENNLLYESNEWLEKMEFAYASGHLNWINYVHAQNNWRDLKLEYLDNVMNLWEAIVALQYWTEQRIE